MLEVSVFGGTIHKEGAFPQGPTVALHGYVYTMVGYGRSLELYT